MTFRHKRNARALFPIRLFFHLLNRRAMAIIFIFFTWVPIYANAHLILDSPLASTKDATNNRIEYFEGDADTLLTENDGKMSGDMANRVLYRFFPPLSTSYGTSPYLPASRSTLLTENTRTKKHPNFHRLIRVRSPGALPMSNEGPVLSSEPEKHSELRSIQVRTVLFFPFYFLAIVLLVVVFLLLVIRSVCSKISFEYGLPEDEWDLYLVANATPA
eukprot:CAMPEP_0195523600 /NCGR_PEP_ID=MMETSP0794_2-20130614/22865_1 /TAXON_ID=515487 /ORGANISM="Stephanopyxis turris, Strain CCMP 815" /LENGTH=216 /DNA_ID=CAMNT_0040653627 /DNA_START=45 /DNA_END=695 /DNA_ORIENTATION=-